MAKKPKFRRGGTTVNAPSTADVLSGITAERRDTPEISVEPTLSKSASRQDMSFGQAFRNARNSGDNTFMWRGRSYGTQMAGERSAAPAARRSTPTPTPTPAARRSTPTPTPAATRPAATNRPAPPAARPAAATPAARPTATNRPAPTATRTAAAAPTTTRTTATTRTAAAAPTTTRTSTRTAAAAPTTTRPAAATPAPAATRTPSGRYETRTLGMRRDRPASPEVVAQRQARNEERRQNVRPVRSLQDELAARERVTRGRVAANRLLRRGVQEETERARAARSAVNRAKGGSVSSRGDGIAKRGKTKGKIT
jgi:hypothetical protein